MSVPTIVATYNSTYTTVTSPKTLTITTQANDVVVVYGGNESGTTGINIPTGRITFSAVQSLEGDASYTNAYLWSGVDATGGTNWTLSVSATAADVHWGVTAVVIRGTNGVRASAQNRISGTAATVSLTTTQDNSTIITFLTDDNALDGSGRTWLTVNGITPTSGNGLEKTYSYDSTHYTAYGAVYTDAGIAGTKTVGLSAPTGQEFSIVAVELLGTPKIHTLTDSFDDGVMDPSLWVPPTDDSYTTETGGTIAVTLPSSTPLYSSMASLNRYDLTSSNLMIEVPQRLNNINGCETLLSIVKTPSIDFVGFVYTPNWLVIRRKVNNTQTDGGFTYNATTMRWWRIREQSGYTYWETSPDSYVWTTRFYLPNPFAVTSMLVNFGAGTWQAIADPGIAKFDNINLPMTRSTVSWLSHGDDVQAFKKNTAETQPNGTTLTTANSGGGNSNAFDAISTQGTISKTFSNETASAGAQSYKIVPSSSSGVFLIYNSPAGDTSGSLQAYFYFTAYPSANQLVLSMRTSSNARIIDYTITETGAVRIYNSTGIFAQAVTSTAGIVPQNTWVRVDLSVTVGATTTTGRYTAALSIGNSTTATWSYDSGPTGNTGTSLIAQYSIGKLDIVPTISTFYIDDIAYAPGATAFIAPIN